MTDVTSSPLAFGPALLAWLAVGVRLPALLRDTARLEQRALCGMLLALSGALTLSFPPVYLGLDQLAGVANLSRLLSDGLAMGAALGLQAFLLLATGDRRTGVRRARSRAVCMVGCLALMTAMFFADPIEVETVDHMIRHAGPSFALYRITYLAFLGAALAAAMHRCWRSARQARSPLVALGLRLYTVAAALGALYLLHGLGQLGIWWSGRANPFARPELLSQGLVGSAAVLVAVGSTVPLWGRAPGVGALRWWFRTYRALRRLRPLWVALTTCSPEIALAPRRGWFADHLDLRDLDFRLYRRVVEIRDGYLSLRPYVDPVARVTAEALATAAGATGGRRRSTVEAARVAAAVAAKVGGRRVAAPDVLVDLAGGADLRGECAWLERVSRAYARSPVVRDVVARGEWSRGAAPTPGG